MNREEKLLYSLSAIKNIFECYDINVEIKIKRNDKEYIVNAYKEIEKFVVDYVNSLQPYKFEDLKELIGKPIFDYKYKEFYILAEVKEEELYKDEGLEKFMICSDKKGLMRVFFEEGRFYPITMEVK